MSLSEDLLLEQIPLDTQEIPSTVLNIEKKNRSNLFTWNGQFSPQFVEALMRQYTHSQSRVLDPFCGSGTVLYEAGRMGLSALGSEINPAAYILSRLYQQINCSKKERLETIMKIDDCLNHHFGLLGGLFGQKEMSEREILSQLQDLQSQLEGNPKYVLEALIILMDFFKGVSLEKLTKQWGKLSQLVIELPYSLHEITVRHLDCRDLASIPAKFDFVLTSPPYLNVYNYHQQYRSSAEFLGWNLLHVAKSEIGSNRKHRGNRFLTVSQYCQDLCQSLLELKKITTEEARIIFVVGRQSNVRGIHFLNGEMVAKIGVECCDLRIELRQERQFKNKFGQQIYEDIIHFKKNSHVSLAPLEKAVEVARYFLKKKLLETPQIEVHMALKEAIQKAAEVAPSPLFHGSQPRFTHEGIYDPPFRKTSGHARQ